MNTSPAQTTTDIDAVDLARIAQLLDVIDQFLRRGNGVAERLAGFYATHHGSAHARYDANLLLDEISFTAHALRGHRADEHDTEHEETGGPR